MQRLISSKVCEQHLGELSEYVSTYLQEEAASALKRKQPASGAKQRSIMEFFKTPPAQPTQKRSKVGGRVLPIC